MFKKIVWATDGSDGADRALEIAKSIATESKASLIAVHTIEYLVSKGTALQDIDDDERQVKIRKQVSELSAAGLDASAKIVQGGMSGAAHTIAGIAKQEGADLIVVGTRGHTVLAGLLLGSVSQRLPHLASCPVMVVPDA